ncbi:MAG: sugar ABC transporter permease [Anaerolineae bacterium]|nr:sugar ABC transporter permease [Anaerolineae bacterium]MDW8170895.1 sugar ABC transporter permease [Anaerolineae bacterium]
MQEDNSAPSWFLPTISVLALAFLAWFIIDQREGLVRLLSWTWNGLAQTPQALQNVANHYAFLPSAQLWPSLLLGALFGASLGAWWMSRFGPRKSGRDTIWGAVGGLLLGLVGSQLLILPMQHCTFAAEAPISQQIIGLGLVLAGVLIALLPFLSWATRRVRRYDSTAGYFRSAWLPYVLLVPMLLSLGLFLYLPSLQMVGLSFFRRRFPLPQERFICLENYTALFQDPIYQNSFITTILLMILIVLLSLGLALGIAVLASQKIRYASVYRTLLIWPFALSPVVAGAIFLTMFREGPTGLINAFTNALFGTEYNWLRDPRLAQVSVIAASVWNILGFNILFYVAGLQNIPKDVLEAAMIDGANRYQRFWQVTFPLLAPFTFFLLVTNVTYAFYGIYGAVDTLTRGGPPLGAAGRDGGATEVLIYKLYQDAFNPGSPVGLAAAQAVILFLMVASLTLLQFRTIDTRIAYAE